MALGFFRRKRADTGKDPCTSPVYGEMADKQTKYEALVHALHGDIYRYAYWLCRDPQIAEDLVQETFLRAWKAIDTLLDDKAASFVTGVVLPIDGGFSAYSGVNLPFTVAARKSRKGPSACGRPCFLDAPTPPLATGR